MGNRNNNPSGSRNKKTGGQNSTSKPSPTVDNTMPAPNNAESDTQTLSGTDLPSEVADATQKINEIRRGLGSLSNVYTTLGEKIAKGAVLTSDTEMGRSLEKLQSEMRAQDEKHRKGIQEINDLLNDLVDVQILKELQLEVDASIEAQIDQMVKEQVAENLKKHIPRQQQEELAKVKRELEDVQNELHNSESRRANAGLRTDEGDGILNTLYRMDGIVSPSFPKDLKALFGLDGGKCKNLALEYGKNDVSDSRESNLNWFIAFCGVSYQMSTNQLGDVVSYRSPTSATSHANFRIS